MPDLRTPAQNRAMWGLVAQLARATGGTRQLAEEALHNASRLVSGQDHTSRLTQTQADRVIAMMRDRVGQVSGRPPSRKRKAPSRPSGSITRRQQEIIAALFAQVGMTDRKRQMGFSRRQCQVPWPQTQAHADKLIEPLKAMALRHVRPGDARRRAQALVGHPQLDAWQRQFIPDLVRQFDDGEKTQRLDKVLSPHKLVKLIEAELACGVTP